MTLTVDFGSTFTKVTAINDTEVVGTSKAFTTIKTDIREGLDVALSELHRQIGSHKYNCRLAASSAGGGLKMIAIGLVPALTAKAASMAACSAGAKVVKTYAYELNEVEAQEIYDINPDLILLSGGTDGGNKEAILHNARVLANLDRGFIVIVAGNKSATSEAARILGKNAVICSNVMPRFNKLEIMPAKNAIQNLFMEKIIEAKGLSEAAKYFSMPIIPTPLAVFEAAQLLSEKLGSLVAVDVGGATTDVYSMCSGMPTLPNVVQKGLPEPYAKRTVEGDLGMRYSMDVFVETALEFRDYQAKCLKNPSFIPTKGSTESKLDERLCGIAIDIASTRHSGCLERVFTPFGESFYQTGKDLSQVKYVIGIGGPIIHSNNPRCIMQNATGGNHEILKPTNPKFLIDKKYVFYAMGLISRINKELALKILLNNMTEV